MTMTEFPQLSRLVYGKRLVYLDNAATSLRPASVIDRWNQISSSSTANLHRAVHAVASEATEAYESARDAVKEFINAASRDEVVFTSGTTHSINLVARSYGDVFLNGGDEIIVSEADHHSNIVPWQMLCKRKCCVLKVLPVDDDGRLCTGLLPSLISARTKLVCVPHVSNVLGLVNPVKEIAAVCHRSGCLLLVDGAQGIVHCEVDVQALGCDFYAFSGHKMYCATGTGVLWARKELLDKMEPMFGGGEMIDTVSWESTTYAPAPRKFEAGTQDISSVPCFREAIEVRRELKEDPRVFSLVYEFLRSEPGIRLFGIPDGANPKVPLFSFCVEGAHHEDLALILDKMGIAVRSGQMCAEPLMNRFGVTGMLRASFAPYNSVEDAEYFVTSLRKAIRMLK